jgi:hypothetical protein
MTGGARDNFTNTLAASFASLMAAIGLTAAGRRGCSA